MKQYEVNIEFDETLTENEIEELILKQLDVEELYIEGSNAIIVVEAEEYYDVEIAMHYVVFSPKNIGDYEYYELI